MQPLHRLCFIALVISLTLPAGCRMLSKQPAAPATAQPVSFTHRVKDSTKFVAGKTKDAAVTTLKYAAAGVVTLGVFIMKSWLDDDEDDDRKRGFDPDPLWRQGYGYNNPNNERIRQGQPPLNFDGSVAE
jgi:hypothetical protein